MPCKVLWRCTNGDAGLKDLKSDIRPFADGFQVNTSVNEGLREIFSSCAKCVGANSHWPGHLVRFKEFDGL